MCLKLTLPEGTALSFHRMKVAPPVKGMKIENKTNLEYGGPPSINRYRAQLAPFVFSAINQSKQFFTVHGVYNLESKGGKRSLSA